MFASVPGCDPFLPGGLVRIDGRDYPLSFSLYGSVSSYHLNGLSKYRTLYVIVGEGVPRSKVGLSDEVTCRLDDLQAGSPITLRIHRRYSVDRAAAVWMERYAHRVLDHCWLHGEWFDCPQETAVAAVQKALRYREAFDRFWNERLYALPEWRAAARAAKKAA